MIAKYITLKYKSPKFNFLNNIEKRKKQKSLAP